MTQGTPSLAEQAREAHEKFEEQQRPYRERQLEDRRRRALRHYRDAFGELEDENVYYELTGSVPKIAWHSPLIDVDEDTRLIYVGSSSFDRDRPPTYQGRTLVVSQKCAQCSGWTPIGRASTLPQLGKALSTEWECKHCNEEDE